MAWPKFHVPPQVTKNFQITEVVQPKDGKTHLARRMLVQYLEQNPEIKITKAQKVFIETTLAEKIPNEAVRKIGSRVELSKQEVEKAVGLSGLLNPLQLKKWENYSQRVSF